MKFTTAEYNKIEDEIIRRIERKVQMGATRECATRWAILDQFVKLGLIDQNTEVYTLNPSALARINIGD